MFFQAWLTISILAGGVGFYLILDESRLLSESAVGKLANAILAAVFMFSFWPLACVFWIAETLQDRPILKEPSRE